MSVRLNVADDAVGQTLLAVDDGKFPILITVQPAPERADPQRSVVRKMQALDEVG